MMVIMDSIPQECKYLIETKDGPVCGYIDERADGTYYIFKGIPYGKAPIGNLRFLPPSPIVPWTVEIDCTNNSPLPLSFCLNTKKIIGSEDCLYVEVYTPNVQPDKPMPVMFWMGCYGFTLVLEHTYDPCFINNQDVVFVKCGFRLGPFGFLSTNDFNAPGNCGLKDIVMALKWVQRNISKFGGDPNNVTIFGNGSGAAIVHFMILSPMASGLFHKAIMQSVSALNNWCLAKNPSQSVMELAKELGIQKTYKVEVVEELRSIPAMDIMEAFTKLLKRKSDRGEQNAIDDIFKPCIEVEFEGQPAFLTKSPYLLIKSANFNKVPLIIGSNNTEASMLYCVKQNLHNFERLNENVCLLVPTSLAGETKVSKIIGHQLLKFYLDGEDYLTEDNKTQYLQLLSDYYFLYYLNKTVRLHSQFAPDCPIYYYIINYAGEWSVPENLEFLNSLGIGTEIPFIFRIKLPNAPVCKGSRDSVNTRNRVVKMWTNFAKYGNPTPVNNDSLLQITWEPVESKDRLNYLSISTELTKGRNPFHERMAFWEELHKEHIFLRALVYMNDLGVRW